MKHRAADHNDRVARDDEDGKPCRKFSVMLVARAPVADAERNEAAQQESLVRDRIENHAERAALIVTPRDVAIEAVTDGREEKDRDGSEALPILRAAFLNALPIINRQRHEYRDHQDPDHGDFVGGCHRKASRSRNFARLSRKLTRKFAAQVSSSAEAVPDVPVCRPSQNSSIIFLLKAGISSGLRLVTRPLSTTTSLSTQCAPAFRISVLIAGQEVTVRPRITLASIRTHGAWQIAATGLPSRKKWRTNSSASSDERNVSGFISPPGIMSASKSSGFASSRVLSTATVSPLSAWFI